MVIVAAHFISSESAKAMALVVVIALVMGCGDRGSPTDLHPQTAVRYVVSASALSAVIGRTVEISAQLVDANDKPVALGGRKVAWSASTSAGGNAGSFSAPTSSTSANGLATVTYTLGTSPHVSYQVSAVDEALPGIVGSTAVMAVAGPVAQYMVSPAVLDPPAGALVVIDVQAADGSGAPLKIANLELTWTNTGTGGQFDTQSQAGYTDANGRLRLGFWTAKTEGATYTITVTDASGAAGKTLGFTTQTQMALSSFASGVGGLSTCGIATDGAAWCWGANDAGQLGDGTRVDRSLAGRVSGTVKFTALSTGLGHACGLTTTGAVQCWGRNGDGELGDNTTVDRPRPGPVASTVVFTAIAAGDHHVCALASGGDVYCWGSNSFGQLGTGAATQLSPLPVKIAGSVSFASIGAGDTHTCGVTTGGAAYCWGSNQFGELGDNTTIDRRSPIAVQGGLKFTTITLGKDHTCALVVNGDAYCWGMDAALGTAVETPMPVTGGLSFQTISAGGAHTCGITIGSAAWCWGGNYSGALGNGSFVSSTAPVQVYGTLSFRSISTGGRDAASDHTCAMTTIGRAFCWGANDLGELGVGPLFSSYSVPLQPYGQP